MLSRSPIPLFTAIFGLRLFLALSTSGFLGVDGGAYLLSALSVQGLESTGTDFMRPPLAPGWLLVPFLSLGEWTTGFNVYSAVFSMPLVIAAYYVTRSLMGVGTAYVVTFLVAFDWVLMGMVVTGVVPLTGFAFVLIASWGMWKLSAQPSKAAWAITAAAIPMIMLTNQTATGLAALILPIQWLLLPNKRRIASALALGALLALPFLGWYLDASPGSGKLNYPGAIVMPHAWWEHQLMVGIGVLYLLFELRHKLDHPTTPPWVRAAAFVVGFLALLQMLQSHNEVLQNLMFRATYLMMPFFWLLVVYFFALPVMKWYRNVRWAPVATSVALALFVGVSVQQFADQRWLSAFADDDIVATAQDIPPDAGRVVTNAYSMALYVAAVAQQPVLWTNYIEPATYYTQDDLDARCTLGWVDGCGPAEGVTHVLIDEKWPIVHSLWPTRGPYGAPETIPWGRLADVPWLTLVETHGTTKLYEVREERS